MRCLKFTDFYYNYNIDYSHKLLPFFTLIVRMRIIIVWIVLIHKRITLMRYIQIIHIMYIHIMG